MMCHRGSGLVPLIRHGFAVCIMFSAGLIILRFRTLSRKIMNRINRIPRRRVRGGGRRRRRPLGFYQNCKVFVCIRGTRAVPKHAPWHRNLSSPSGSQHHLLIIPPKIAEVLAFMKNLPRGPVRWTEPKPKVTKHTCGLQAGWVFCCS